MMQSLIIVLSYLLMYSSNRRIIQQSNMYLDSYIEESIQFSNMDHMPGDIDHLIKCYLCKKQQIDWQEEMKTWEQFPELAYLHKSDSFIKPCECHIEHCHRYWIGREVFIKKSIKWSLCGKFLKVGFRQVSLSKRSTAVKCSLLCLIITGTLVIWICVALVCFALISDLNLYQKVLTIISLFLIAMMSTIFIVIKSTSRFYRYGQMKNAYIINFTSNQKMSTSLVKRHLTKMFKSTKRPKVNLLNIDKATDSFVRK